MCVCLFVCLSVCPSVRPSVNKRRHVSVLWLKAKYHAMKNEMEHAVTIMNHIADFLDFLKTELNQSDPISYHVINCRVDNVISKGALSEFSVMEMSASIFILSVTS